MHDLFTHVRDRDPDVVTLPQALRAAGYLAVSYGKIFHHGHDDERSWSPQAEFADNETWRGLRGHAWRRAGGFRLGWRYNQYMTPQYQRAVGCAQPAEGTRGGPRGAACAGCTVYARVPPFERGPESNANGAGYTGAVLATRAVRALRRLRAQPAYFLAVGFIRPHLPFARPRYFDAARSRAAARARARRRVGADGTCARARASSSRLASARAACRRARTRELRHGCRVRLVRRCAGGRGRRATRAAGCGARRICPVGGGGGRRRDDHGAARRPRLEAGARGVVGEALAPRGGHARPAAHPRARRRAAARRHARRAAGFVPDAGAARAPA